MFCVFCVITILFIVWIGLRIRDTLFYWKKYQIPSINFTLQWKCSMDLLFSKRNIAVVVQDIYRHSSKEKFVGFSRILAPHLLILDPELIGGILIKNFNSFHDRRSSESDGARMNHTIDDLIGENWKKVRGKVSPCFSSLRLKSIYKLVERCTEMLDSHIRYARLG